jgi:hypothetical protein
MFKLEINGLQIARIRNWIKALRSGEYKQSFGKTKYNNTLCATGVAFEISKTTEWEQVYLFSNWFIAFNKNSICREFYGMEEFFSIESFNDSGHSFNEVANFIEENLNSHLISINYEEIKENPGVLVLEEVLV